MANIKKKIFQIDLVTGDIVAEYDGLEEAEKSTNISGSYISAVCRGKHTKGCGYAWSNADGLEQLQTAIREKQKKLQLLQAEAKETKKEDKPKSKPKHKAKPKKSVRVDKEEAIKLLKKHHGTLSYNELSRKTGYTYKELQRLYDRNKIYKFGFGRD